MVAGRGLQQAVEADLGRGEAALLVRVFAVERHVFAVRNHGVGDVERPALGSTNGHAAPLGGDEAASCEDEDRGMNVLASRVTCAKYCAKAQRWKGRYLCEHKLTCLHFAFAECAKPEEHEGVWV